jgi:antitoxin HicB
MTKFLTRGDTDNAVVKILRRPYARIILPDSDGSFRGEILEFPGCIVTGDTAAKALEALEDAADGWVRAALEKGQPIPQPIDNNNEYSGKLVLRIPKSLHKKATWLAEREGVSLNQFITASLSESVGGKYYSNIFVSAVTSVVSNLNIGVPSAVNVMAGGIVSMGQLAQVYSVAAPFTQVGTGLSTNSYSSELVSALTYDGGIQERINAGG